MNDDNELLLRYVQEGSQEAFTELVRRHVSFVYGWSLRRAGGNAQIAEDATQQVLLLVARKASVLSERKPLEGWLYTTTRQVTVNLMRTQMRRRARERSDYIVSELHPSAPDSSFNETLKEALAGLLDRLNEREAVLLRFIVGRTYSEIGSTLAITEEGARSRVDRAVGKMRQFLASRGIRSTAAAISAALA